MTGTHYQILAVKKKATAAEVKCAYRRLVKMAHPDVDKTPGAADRFMAIQEAYEVLSDPARRAAYDVSLRAKKAPPAGAANSSAGAPPRSTPPPSPPPAGAAGAGARPGSSGPPPRPPIPTPPAPPNWALVFAAIGRVLWGRLRPYAVGGLIGGFISVVIIVAVGINTVSHGAPSEESRPAHPAVHISLGPTATAPPVAQVSPQTATDSDPKAGEQASPESADPSGSAPPDTEEAPPPAGETPPAEAEPAFQVAGRWRGVFEENGRIVPFSLQIEEGGNEITGRGSELDGRLVRRFSVRGRVNGGNLDFEKSYGRFAPPVYYRAALRDEHRMRGSWELGLWQGEWRAERWEEIPVPTERQNAREWGGWIKPKDDSWRLRPHRD